MAGLAFVCSTSPVRQSTPRALRASSIFAGFAQFEREMMLERQREGIARRRLRIATWGGGRRSRRAPCRRQAAFYRPQGTPSTSHSSSPNETATTGTFETTKPRTGSSYGSTSATRASPRGPGRFGSRCLRWLLPQQFQLVGGRRGRWDSGMDRRRRGVRFVPVFGRSERRL